MTDYQQTQPASQWRGPTTRAVVVTDADGRRRITFQREGIFPAFTDVPVRQSGIPATAEGVAAHFRASGLLKRPPSRRPVTEASLSPVPTPDEYRAMRERLDMSQRDAAAAAHVSRGFISELETPRKQPSANRRPSANRDRSPQAVKYAAWLRRAVAALGAGQ